jgi:hypothetical protein
VPASEARAARHGHRAVVRAYTTRHLGAVIGAGAGGERGPSTVWCRDCRAAGLPRARARKKRMAIWGQKVGQEI